MSQMEFDEKELRKEISYAIKNIHGVRQVVPPWNQTSAHICLLPCLSVCVHSRPTVFFCFQVSPSSVLSLLSTCVVCL